MEPDRCVPCLEVNSALRAAALAAFRKSSGPADARALTTLPPLLTIIATVIDPDIPWFLAASGYSGSGTLISLPLIAPSTIGERLTSVGLTVGSTIFVWLGTVGAGGGSAGRLLIRR